MPAICHKRLLLPHLIMVTKVVYPYVLLHVGVIEILPQPSHITPIEVPLTFTVKRRKAITHKPKLKER